MDSMFKDTLEGDFIRLKKVTTDDAADIYGWRTSESGRYLRQPENYTVQSQVKWIESRGDGEINYIIYSRQTGEKVGMVAIYDVNHYDRVSNAGRLLLAAPYLKKSNPYGLEALLLVYGYIFKEMDFRKITGDMLGANGDMFKLQKFLGMQQEGFLKRHTVINGEVHDLYIMSIFQEDFPAYANKIRFLLKGFRK